MKQLTELEQALQEAHASRVIDWKRILVAPSLWDKFMNQFQFMMKPDPGSTEKRFCTVPVETREALEWMNLQWAAERTDGSWLLSNGTVIPHLHEYKPMAPSPKQFTIIPTRLNLDDDPIERAREGWRTDLALGSMRIPIVRMMGWDIGADRVDYYGDALKLLWKSTLRGNTPALTFPMVQTRLAPEAWMERIAS